MTNSSLTKRSMKHVFDARVSDEHHLDEVERVVNRDARCCPAIDMLTVARCELSFRTARSGADHTTAAIFSPSSAWSETSTLSICARRAVSVVARPGHAGGTAGTFASADRTADRCGSSPRHERNDGVFNLRRRVAHLGPRAERRDALLFHAASDTASPQRHRAQRRWALRRARLELELHDDRVYFTARHQVCLLYCRNSCDLYQRHWRLWYAAF